MKTLTAILIAALGSGAAGSADAATRRVTIVNATPNTMMRLYASPSDAPAQDEDLLGDAVLKPGQSAAVAIGGGGDACVFDLKGSFDTGATKIRAKIDVCAAPTYRFTAG